MLRFHFVFVYSFLHVLFFWMEVLPVRGQCQSALGSKGPDASQRRLGPRSPDEVLRGVMLISGGHVMVQNWKPEITEHYFLPTSKRKCNIHSTYSRLL